VLAGAFELEGWLLHKKNGLALWETEEMEFEDFVGGAGGTVAERS
jgi:hypothetical protein